MIVDTDTPVQSAIRNHIDVVHRLLDNDVILETVKNISREITGCLKKGNKVLFCGNGGSAADAQHLAAEFTGRYYIDREPLFAEALHVNTSYLTAVANDYSYDEVFSRLVRAKGREGDVLIGLSTSGNSENIIRAISEAKNKKMITVAFTGRGGGRMKGLCTYMVDIPSHDTPRIQEAHILLGHIICENVEKEMFCE